MRTYIQSTILTVTLLLATTLTARAADPAPSPAPTKEMYLRYCGACHGPDGRGDGVAGTFMRPKPTDLTQIATRNKGEFPFNRVMAYIDGSTEVRAHGDPSMPVWGEVFRAESTWPAGQRAEVQGKLMQITDYVRSIQTK